MSQYNTSNNDQQRMPSYRLVITDKENRKRRTNAGVLFKSQYGFNLLLNPGVQLSYEDQELYFFNLYPITTQHESDQYQQQVYTGDSVDEDGGAGFLHFDEMVT